MKSLFTCLCLHFFFRSFNIENWRTRKHEIFVDMSLFTSLFWVVQLWELKNKETWNLCWHVFVYISFLGRSALRPKNKETWNLCWHVFVYISFLGRSALSTEEQGNMKSLLTCFCLHLFFGSFSFEYRRTRKHEIFVDMFLFTSLFWVVQLWVPKNKETWNLCWHVFVYISFLGRSALRTEEQGNMKSLLTCLCLHLFFGSFSFEYRRTRHVFVYISFLGRSALSTEEQGNMKSLLTCLCLHFFFRSFSFEYRRTRKHEIFVDMFLFTSLFWVVQLWELKNKETWNLCWHVFVYISFLGRSALRTEEQGNMKSLLTCLCLHFFFRSFSFENWRTRKHEIFVDMSLFTFLF